MAVALVLASIGEILATSLPALLSLTIGQRAPDPHRTDHGFLEEELRPPPKGGEEEVRAAAGHQFRDESRANLLSTSDSAGAVV